MPHLLVAWMLVAVSHSLALRLTQIDLGARQLSGGDAASTLLLDNLQAQAAVTFVTSFGTDVTLAFQRFLAGIPTGANFLGAGRLRGFFSARTRS